MKKSPESAPGVWLFAYGSLLLEGHVETEERRLAQLQGFHRALCVYSHVYRGTKARPGLVLGLARGGSCLGVALRIAGPKADAVLGRIRRRELVTGVYLERVVSVALRGQGGKPAQRASAVAFIADRSHPQYAGKLSSRAILRYLRQGKGTKGRATDYLFEIMRGLHTLGIRDRALERIAKSVPQKDRG